MKRCHPHLLLLHSTHIAEIGCALGQPRQGVGLTVEGGEIQLKAAEAPLLMSVLVVEAAMVSVSTPTTIVRAAVEVVILAAVEVVVRVTVEVIVAFATAAPTAIACATAVPAAGCTTMLPGAKCMFARAPSVRAASASIDIDVVLRLAINAIDVGARQLPLPRASSPNVLGESHACSSSRSWSPFD
jgi:hypothetical protein